MPRSPDVHLRSVILNFSNSSSHLVPMPVPPSRWKIILAFGLVYVFWGSTYLGIGIAVERIPPALMCAVRFSIAGVVMLAYCALSGHRVRFSARQLGHLAIVGILLLMAAISRFLMPSKSFPLACRRCWLRVLRSGFSCSTACC